MDINQASPIMPKHPDSRTPHHERDHSSDADKKEDDKTPSGSWRNSDAVDIDQSLIGAFTPEVQSIIDTLRHEIEPLRRRLDSAEHRVDEFRGLAAQHVFLNVPNRREILREIDHVIVHKAALSIPPILILMHIANADQVRRELGRQGLDRYLTEICERVSNTIEETTAFGNICGNDFALLMLGVDYTQAKRSAEQIVLTVCAEPIDMGGSSIPIQFLIGIADLRYVVDAQAAVLLADQNMV